MAGMKHAAGKLRTFWLGTITALSAVLYAAAISLPIHAQETQADLSIYQVESHYVTLPMGATSAAAGEPQQGHRVWNVFLNNQSQTPVTNASVTVNSGFDASLFTWGSFEPLSGFPQTKTVASLLPGEQWEPSTISSEIPVSFTPGYDSTRTVSPAAIPAGGGQQTVTVTIRPVDPRFTPGPNVYVNVVLDSEIPGVTVASTTNPANLNQGEILNSPDNPVGLHQWQVGMLQLNKTYTFTATLNVPNTTGTPLDYQPSVNLRNEHSTSICNDCTGSSVSIPEPSLDGDTLGSGLVTYSVTEADRAWTIARSESWDVVYPGTPKPQEPMQIGIVVNPGTGDPALVMPWRFGLVVVAIPSTDDLDASMIDLVKFGVTGTEVPPLAKAMLDINRDGRKDLLMVFSTKNANIVCGTKQVVLTGKFAMADARGEAAIRTLCKETH